VAVFIKQHRMQTSTLTRGFVFAMAATFGVGTIFFGCHAANAATYSITDVANGAIVSAVLPPLPIVNSPAVIWPASGTGCIGPNCFRDPFEGTAWAGSQYLSVGGNGSATYSVFAANTLKLLWGSVDQYNGIEFRGGTIGDLIIMGSDPQLYPVRAPGAGHDFVSILFTDPGAFFTSVTFFNSPGNDGFELSNITACVGLEVCANQEFLGASPLPAALPLFASGLSALAVLAWRRKRKAVTA
jgi:hypothetical protein